MTPSSKPACPLASLYDIGEVIGKGRFSVVKKAKHIPTGQTVAIKIIKKKKVDHMLIMREIAALRSLDHPSIVKFIDAAESSSKLYLVLEYCPGGELLERIISRKKYTEADAALIFKQILSAVDYMHTNHVVHRDLKPENCLYSSDNVVKVADFGLARFSVDAAGQVVPLNTTCGTLYYTSPQILCNESYGKECDVWSLGVVLYTMLTGFPPFDDPSPSEIFNKILRGKLTFPSPYCDHISLAARDLISKMIVVNVFDRITTREALFHPFFANVGSTCIHLNGVVDQLTHFNARRKFKSAITLLTAVNLFKKIENNTNKIEEEEDEDES
ncbi:hypothetical protein RCL1_002299 [Eukaryota sp. TZLM3-RCL]